MKITKIAKQAEYNNYVDFEDALDFDECWELVKSHVKSNNIRISGTEHQERYLPVIDDKYIFLLSQRVWGKLMCEVWSVEDNIDYKYSNWAWWTPEETKGGGARIIYVNVIHDKQIHLLLCYAKVKQENLTDEQKQQLKALIKVIKEG